MFSTVKRALCCIALFGVMSSSAWGDTQLQPFAGTIELGGKLHFPMEINHQGDFAMAFQMNPSLGFFVNDGWEIVLRGILQQPIAGEDFTQKRALGYHRPITDVASTKAGGFGVGFEYLFDSGYILPYLGTFMDFVWSSNESMQIHLEAPMGILVPFNDYIAADLGVAVQFIFPVNTGFDRVVISPGFLGVRAFF